MSIECLTYAELGDRLGTNPQAARSLACRLEKHPLGLADGRFIAMTTERRGRKLLRQDSVRTG
jgi:hypothetical protein